MRPLRPLRLLRPCALAGAFVLLALGALASSPAWAQATPPAVPNLSVTPVAGSTDKLDVSWSAVNGIHGYDIHWKTGSQSYVDTRRIQVDVGSGVHPTSTQITGLTASTAYSVRVTAVEVDTVNGTEIIRAQSETTATTNAPALPGLTVTPVAGSHTKLDVEWDAVAGTAQYNIRWKTSSQSSYPDGNLSTNFPLVDPNPTTKQIPGLAADTTYTVRVTAAGPGGAVLAQSEVTATTNDYPAVPNLTVTPVADSPDRLDVKWDAVNGTSIYRIQYKTGTQNYSYIVRTDWIAHPATTGLLAHLTSNTE